MLLVVIVLLVLLGRGAIKVLGQVLLIAYLTIIAFGLGFILPFLISFLKNSLNLYREQKQNNFLSKEYIYNYWYVFLISTNYNITQKH